MVNGVAETMKQNKTTRFTTLKKWYVAFSIICTNFIVLLVLFEGVSFLALKVRYGRNQAQLLEFDYAPYRMMKVKAAPWPLNPEGFRAKPLNHYLNSSRKRFRIVFLGGSVCAGYGGNNGPPLPNLLQKRLYKLGIANVEIINLGQAGAVSAQELAILIQYGLKLKPQFVVSFNGLNDLFHPRPLGPDEAPNLPYENHLLRDLWKGSWYNRTSLWRLLASKPPAPQINEVPVESIVSSYVQTMDLTHKLTKAYGITHAVLLQPSSWLNKPLSPKERHFIETRYKPRHMKRGALLFQKAIHAFNDWSRQDDSRHFFDLTSAFAHEEKLIYEDTNHFANRSGYPRLLEMLENKGFIDQILNEYSAWKQDIMSKSRSDFKVPQESIDQGD